MKSEFKLNFLPPYIWLGQYELVDVTATKEMRILCPYCADDRPAYLWEGAWWHEVARGGDMGQSEPCLSGKLRTALNV